MKDDVISLYPIPEEESDTNRLGERKVNLSKQDNWRKK